MGSDASAKPSYLDPSPLGTKEYWSSLYTTDLQTRQSSLPTHTGTTWFDDADAEGKTVRYISSLSAQNASVNHLSLTNTSFLDLGTGNGSLLFALRKAGWQGRMVGVDYADESVALAKNIWNGIVENGWEADSDEEDDAPEPSMGQIDFRVLDILSLSNPETILPEWMPADGFDVVLDKGTFDAVSLSSDIDPQTGRRIVESYAIAAKRLLSKPTGRMVITSCNWTEQELEKWFCGEDNVSHIDPPNGLRVIDRVPYRKFKFGGKEGSVVVGIVFGWNIQ